MRDELLGKGAHNVSAIIKLVHKRNINFRPVAYVTVVGLEIRAPITRKPMVRNGGNGLARSDVEGRLAEKSHGALDRCLAA